MASQMLPTPILNDPNQTLDEKREMLKHYLSETFDLENSLFSLINSDEGFVCHPDPLRHPLIFYYGHTACFYINKLIFSKQLYKRVNEHYESLFAIGIDEMHWDEMKENTFQWPSFGELKLYREKVKNTVLNLIDHIQIDVKTTWNSPEWAIIMAIEHQRIHIETSSVLIRQLPLAYIDPKPEWAVCKMKGSPPENQLLTIPSAIVNLGKMNGDSLYGWDNEYGAHSSKVDEFKMSQYLVSNQEYLPFIKEDEYCKDQWWSNEGLQWRNSQNKQMPSFWIKRNGLYFLRTLQDEIEMPWDWPVEVNYHEAKAFCTWKSSKTKSPIRLPSEDEYYRLHKHCEVPNVDQWENAPGNINLEHFRSSCPINIHKIGEFYDVIGNVWQWTETPIYPFSGFQVHPLYDDFSVPTFDDKHNLIKGGSWISTGNLANKDSRYAFRRHFLQHAGFRYVESPNQIQIQETQYSSDKDLSEYCNLHYGISYFGVPNFPKTCVDTIKPFFKDINLNRALDLGCSVGRSSFELARYFQQVTGLDFSARFIDKAISIKQSGKIKYELIIEGELFAKREQYLDKLELINLKGEIEFYQADACNLSEKWSNYDLVFAANLIDRLYSPATFLKNIHNHMTAGGLLVIVSPYTWLEEYTSKKEWIGGKKIEGKEVKTLEGLKRTLAPHFQLIAKPLDIPFIIRETKRKYQHTVSEMTIWKFVK